MTSTSSRAAVPTVGGYRLLSLIGEGGMGMVHLAEDQDGRRAALKVLRPNVVGDEESRRRLAQEVDSLRHVHSEHVAEILDADPWGEVPYVVTRFVAGQSLHAHVAESGPLSGEDLEHAARGLLLAIRDVHAAQVLHRDIKPTNVVMEGPSPILIDFGLARLAEDPRLTATGWLMGTPGYLAPEVLLGGSASTATDVHGWAATLVYAATGHSPYGRGHTMAVLDRTRHGDLDLSGLPDRLRPLLAAALATEPRRRPTVPQALAALGATDSSETSAPPRTRPYTVLAPSRPSDTPAVAACRMPARLTGWGRVRHFLSLVVLAGVVTAGFGAAPYLTATAVAVAVLLSRGLSHGRQATSLRRSVRGRKWFDGPTALLSYPWHLVRGSLGGLVLVLVSAALAAAASVGTVVGGARPGQALIAGGGVLAVATWCGPGSARVREPVGGMLTRTARHPALWFLVVTGLVVGGVAAWWAGTQDGVLWAPASGAPWRELRGLAEDVGLVDTGL